MNGELSTIFWSNDVARDRQHGVYAEPFGHTFLVWRRRLALV